MKTKAFIISQNKVVAQVETDLKNGEAVIYSHLKLEEKINAARAWNLVNAGSGKISRNKKWEKSQFKYGKEVNKGEFFILGE